MTPLPQPPPVAAPAIETRQQLDAVLENIAHLQRERDELFAEQEREIAAVRQKYRAPIAEMERYLDLETSWAESWARANPGAFAADCSLAGKHATIGFRATPPRIERASRRWTWSRIALTLASLPWGKRYLRIPSPEVDKEAILADLADLSPLELRNAGIKVAQGERFFITPNLLSESDWQEAVKVYSTPRSQTPFGNAIVTATPLPVFPTKISIFPNSAVPLQPSV